MKYFFIDGEEQGIYTGGIQMDAGTIKVGDILRPKDENGLEFVLKITEIKDYDLDQLVNTLSGKKDGFLVLSTLDNKKLPKNPSGSLYFGSAVPDVKDLPKVDIGTTCMVDGTVWKGANYYNSSSYFPNGNQLLATAKPYLIISFRSAQAPDDRQITLVQKDIKLTQGVLNKNNYELVLSGSSDGVPSNSCLVSNWKNGEAKTQKTDFHFEITKLQDNGDHLILSAKYYGKIYGLNLLKGLIGVSCKDVVIKDGIIDGLKVNVIRQ